MAIWAISDLHLSLAQPAGREQYAERWRDHVATIARHWRASVGPRDLVLLPGDVSMARNHRDLQPDLAWLDRLPGLKVLSRGNHDAWWNDVARIRPLLRRSERAVGGDALDLGEAIVCGTRGSPAPDDALTPRHQGDAARELAALDTALTHACQLRTADQPIYVLWHYPPFTRNGDPGPAIPRLEAAGVTACVYGHLHTEALWSAAVQGQVRGIRYACVAADALGFRPLRLTPPPP